MAGNRKDLPDRPLKEKFERNQRNKSPEPKHGYQPSTEQPKGEPPTELRNKN